MWYLTTTLIWLVLLALAFGAFVGWRSCRETPRKEGLGWLGIALAVFILGLLAAALKVFKGVPGLALDTALILFAAYIIGCCIGCLFGRQADAAPVAAVAAAAPMAAAARAAAPQPAAPAAAKPAPAPKPAGPPVVRPYQWQAARDTNSVTLTGYAPSEADRDAIAAAAQKAVAPLPVIDKLQLGGGAPAGLSGMASTALGHLGQLDRGIASLIDGKYTLTGVSGTSAAYDSVMAGVKALPAGFSLAKVDIVAPPAAKVAATAPAVAAPPVAAPAPAPTPAPVAEPQRAAVVEGEDKVPGKRPVGFVSPRGGKADDLKRIRGIGKQNEARLHGLGIWHFDQVSSWSADEALWVGSYLAFPGRIEREEWISQAKVLATGGETAFSQRVARGEVATSADDGSKGQGNVEKLEPLRPVKK